MALRMELLEVGESLGWPRIPIRPGVTCGAGEGNWKRLARGPIGYVAPALRNAKIRAANLAGAKEDPMVRIVTFDDYVKYEEPQAPPTAPHPVLYPKYTAEMRRANLAKAREAKKAKAAANAD